jgi:hypothetical protein
MQKRRHFFWLMIPLLFGALALLVMLLWNAILPALLHTQHISYWQALGLLVLCRILFGGLPIGSRNGGPSFDKRSAIKEKWMNMSDDERNKLKEEWRRRCRKP